MGDASFVPPESEELQMFADSIDAFLDDHVTHDETAKWRADGAVSPAMWRLAGQAGLLGVLDAAEYGGGGADFRFEIALMERFGGKYALNFAIPLHDAVDGTLPGPRSRARSRSGDGCCVRSAAKPFLRSP